MTGELRPPSDSSRSTEPDIVERLIRLAGSRPASQADRAQRVRDAVHVAWHESVQPRRTSRLRFAGVLLAAACVILAVSMWRPRTPNPAAPSNPTAGRLTAVVGAIERLDSARAPVRVGDAAAVGSSFETGAGALATVALIGRGEVRVNEKTVVHFTGAREIRIERGAIYLDSGSRGGSLTVRTPLGVVRDVGTRFEVAGVGDGWRVRVREGQVRVEGGAAPREAGAGSELMLESTGRVVERPSTIYGDDWGWVVRAAPTFEIEGRTLGEFLDWVARESGRRVEFTDDELRQSMTGTILHGSIEGLTAEQSLDVVLPTCGLAHEIASQRVIVSRPSRRSRGLD